MGDQLLALLARLARLRPEVDTFFDKVMVNAEDLAVRGNFIRDGSLPATDDGKKPRRVNDNWPVLALVLDCGPSPTPDCRTAGRLLRLTLASRALKPVDDITRRARSP